MGGRAGETGFQFPALRCSSASFRAVGPCSARARRTQGCWWAGGVPPWPPARVARSAFSPAHRVARVLTTLP